MGRMIIGSAKNHEACQTCKSASFVALTETATRYDLRSKADMGSTIFADPATGGVDDLESRKMCCLW